MLETITYSGFKVTIFDFVVARPPNLRRFLSVAHLYCLRHMSIMQRFRSNENNYLMKKPKFHLFVFIFEKLKQLPSLVDLNPTTSF